MKILIDTNIFLDFYRSNTQPIEIFSELTKYRDKIILTDQIIQEFERNRERVIRSVKKNFELESKINDFSSSYLQNLKEFKELLQIQKDYRLKQGEVNNHIERILEDPEMDPIAIFFKEFVNQSNKEGSIYYASDEIIQKAQKRKYIGNPPTSDKYSLGDEINWEIVLHNLKEDIVIVGRDNTFNNNLKFLQKDFHKNTGFLLYSLTNNIADALRKIGVTASAKLIEEERRMIEEIKLFNDYWKHHTS